MLFYHTKCMLKHFQKSSKPHVQNKKIRLKKWSHQLMFSFIDMVTAAALEWERGMDEARYIQTVHHRKLLQKNLEHKRGRDSSTVAGGNEEKKRRGPTTPTPVLDVHLETSAHWMVIDGQKHRYRLCFVFIQWPTGTHSERQNTHYSTHLLYNMQPLCWCSS